MLGRPEARDNAGRASQGAAGPFPLAPHTSRVPPRSGSQVETVAVRPLAVPRLRGRPPRWGVLRHWPAAPKTGPPMCKIFGNISDLGSGWRAISSLSDLAVPGVRARGRIRDRMSLLCPPAPIRRVGLSWTDPASVRLCRSSLMLNPSSPEGLHAQARDAPRTARTACQAWAVQALLQDHCEAGKVLDPLQSIWHG